jgi:hypothetical protein
LAAETLPAGFRVFCPAKAQRKHTSPQRGRTAIKQKNPQPRMEHGQNTDQMRRQQVSTVTIPPVAVDFFCSVFNQCFIRGQVFFAPREDFGGW